ncbi:hypothetical protein ACM61V_02015 [Sphingomonas sp. TX0543]|uniref:hypothetical protein n=1 Tax=unclassified Sphingomonas TaxID=196159 RepID=UPI0010F65C98|nr:hypothetical protein [Sphingomonas sp. 3P27F8]
MNWLALGGSLTAVLALGGIAAFLRLGRVDRMLVEEADAIVAADEAIAGFAGVSAVIGADGRAALVFGEDRRVVVLKVHGARIAARVIAWEAVRAAPGGMVVETGERRFGAVTLRGVDALDVRRLAPQLTRV